MYELYIASPWVGTSSHFFDTIDEVLHELHTWGFKFVWDFCTGKEILHAFTTDANGVHGMVAQVFKDGTEITKSIEL